ncbi:WD40 repeat domain-containing protein [Streptomyces sp. NPDC048057]|uniref:WD40 repeat domain-containing protein n=1 Tax=Streptomyces sp. NPDC048057 TaxID=3155628 RepID=UPI0034007E4B
MFAIGTAEYKDAYWSPLPKVHPDVATVIQTLDRFGYAPAASHLTGMLDPLESRDVELSMLRWLREHFGFEDDVLVVYCAGHGVEEYDHYLICSDTESDPAALKVTALATARLVELAADAGVQRLLVVIDACYAGDGAADVLAQTAKSHLLSVCASRRDQRMHWKSLAVLSAARSGEEAQDGAFAETLAAVLGRAVEKDRVLVGERPPYIHLSDVVREVNREMSARSLTQRADLAVVHDDGTGFLPNPRHVGGLDEDLDLAEQRVASEQHRLRRKDLVEHFAPRGVGAHGPEETGHYFTGRTAVLTRLAGWLRGDSERDVRLFRVTGGPGTGKSSVLGRLVTRSNPATRHRIPDDTVIVSTDVPPGTVDLAVHAAGKRLTDVLGALADALEAPTADTADVMKALTALSQPFTLVIDALDEAARTGGAHEAVNIDSFLGRATHHAPYFRVLAGARPEAFENSTGSETVALLDLDDPQWIARRDLVDYSARLLAAPHGQGSSSGLPHDLVDRAASEIGRVAFPNYLVARIVSRALASPDRDFWNADPTTWASMLPQPLEQAVSRRRSRPYAGIGPAFLWARNVQLSPDQTHLYRSVLLPLAYAFGSGLPLPGIWAGLASLMYGEPVIESEIADLLTTDAAAAYVTEAVDAHGRSVYRLYHQALADDLRRGHVRGVMDNWLAQPASGGVATSTQIKRFIAQAVHRTLLDCVPQTPEGTRDWRDADPYLLDHLTAHASEAGALDDLLVDYEFLVHANPDHITPYLQEARSDAARQATAVYRASLGRHRSAPPELRRWTLALDAVRAQDYELAERLQQGALPLLPCPDWTTASPQPALLRSLNEVAALTILPDSPLAVTANDDGTIQLRNLSDGTAVTGADATESGPITDMACLDDDERSLLVTGHANGDVRVWDLSLDTPYSQLLPLDRDSTAQASMVLVDCVVVDKRIVVVATDEHKCVRTWELEGMGAVGTAKQVACLPTGTMGEARPALVRLYGVPCLATSRPGGGFSLWTLPGVEPFELTGDGGTEAVLVSALATPADTGNANSLIVAGDASGTVHSWSVAASRYLAPAGREGRHRFTGPGARIRTIATARVEDEAVVVTGHESGHVRLWNMGDHDAVSLVGHNAPVRTVHVTRLDTGLAAVTTDDAGRMNVWDLEHAMTHPPVSLRANVLASTRVGNGAVAVTGHSDGDIRVWNSVLGRLIDRYPRMSPESEPVTALGCTGLPLAPGPSIVSCHGGHVLRFRDGFAPTATGHCIRVGPVVTVLDCVAVAGSAVALTGHADGSLRLWDFADPEHPVTLLAAGGPPVVSIACTSATDGNPTTAVTGHADGTCLFWNLERQTRSGRALSDDRSTVVTLAMAPPGPRAASAARLTVVGHASGAIFVHDGITGGPAGPPLAGSSAEAGLQALACLSQGGRPFVLAGHQDSTLDLFDLTTRTLVESASVSASITALSWASNRTPGSSPDGLLSMIAGSELYVLGGGFGDHTSAGKDRSS